ncbi:MAG: phosphodiester glycosidase family protein, partial [Candidatus Eremiobacterota bacterium]
MPLRFALLLALLLVARVEAQPEWTPVFQGVCLTRILRQEPEPLAVYAVRIDLTAPGLSFLVSPPNGDRPLDTDAKKTGTFLHESGCQVAINASPFLPLSRREGTPMDVVGISVSKGNRYSEPNPPWWALLIAADNQARLVSQEGEVPAAHNAVGGFAMLLQNGVDVAEEGGPRHPRSCVGLSRDGKTMFLAVIDGRQPGYSVGATQQEAAGWMKFMGAWEALNLDGGGSSALVIQDEYGLPQVVNRPIERGVPGLQRPSANHLGVFAQP